MSINDVLPLKGARRDAIANLQCFGAPDTRDLMSMVTFTFTMRRHLIRLASASFVSSRFTTFGWVRLPCATRGKHNAEFTKGGWELWSYFKPFCGPTFMKFSVDVGSPLYFKTPISDCLCRVSFRRYSPLSLEVVEKRSKCKSFLAPNFCGRDGSDFATAVSYDDLLRNTHYSSNFGWVPFADVRMRSLAMKQNHGFR